MVVLPFDMLQNVLSRSASNCFYTFAACVNEKLGYFVRVNYLLKYVVCLGMLQENTECDCMTNEKTLQIKILKISKLDLA